MALTQISTAGVKDDAVTSGKIPANAVGSSELADNAVDTAAIAANAVTNPKIVSGAIDTGHLADDAVTAAKIADNAINSDRLSSSAVSTTKLATNSVTTVKIADGNVTTAKLANEAVTLAKLEHGTSSNNGKFLRANNGADPTFETVSTDLVADTSPQLGGDLASNGNDIVMADNDSIKLGASTDFIMYHDSSGHTFLQDQGTGALRLRSDSEVAIQKWDGSNNENMAIFVPDAQVELYHNGNKRFSTASGGFNLKEGDTTRLSFTYSNSLAFITANAGNEIKVSSGNGDANGIEFWDYTGVNKRCQIDGHGIKFNSDTAANNALDDFEKGSWTPRIGPISNNSIYESGVGTYTKVGDKVTVYYAFINKNPNSFGSAVARLWNLPYNIRNAGNTTAAYDYGTCDMMHNLTFNHNGKTVFYTNNNTSELIGLESRTGTTWVNWTLNNFANGFYLHGHLTYFTDNY